MKSFKTVFVTILIILISVVLCSCGRDKVAPEISCSEVLEIQTSSTKIDIQALFSAEDNVDGDITGKISIDDSSVDYSSVGQYTIIVSVQDEAENVASQEYTINVIANPNDVLNAIEALYCTGDPNVTVNKTEYDKSKNTYTIHIDDSHLDDGIDMLSEYDMDYQILLVVNQHCSSMYAEALPSLVNRVFEMYGVTDSHFTLKVYYKLVMDDFFILEYQDGVNTYDRFGIAW